VINPCTGGTAYDQEIIAELIQAMQGKIKSIKWWDFEVRQYQIISAKDNAGHCFRSIRYALKSLVSADPELVEVSAGSENHCDLGTKTLPEGWVWKCGDII
jgi:hypothetical protein